MRKDLLDFEESKALLYILCDACRIPMPAVRKVDAVGYLGEQYALEVRLREENDVGTVVHEWLHYVFTLCWLERVHWAERGDEIDNMEHRVVLFLEPIVAQGVEKLYKTVKKNLKW